jgi:SecY
MPSGQPQDASHGLPIRAIVVSVCACAAFVALSFVRLPGLRAEAVDVARLSVGMLGLGPILMAFVVTELVAAFVPGLRPLRQSIEGRARLRHLSFLLAIGFATIEIIGIVRYAQRIHLLHERSVFDPSGSDPYFILAGLLMVGVVAAMTLAWIIDVAGIGVGYSLLLAATILSALAHTLPAMLEVDESLTSIFLVCAFAFASYRMLRSRAVVGTTARYRVPTAGVEPVHQAILVALLALQSGLARAFFWPLVPEGLPRSGLTLGLQVVLTASLCKLLPNVFHRPATAEDYAALKKATRTSTIWLCALVFGTAYINQVARIPVVFDWLTLIALVAVGMDVASELRAHWQNGPQHALRVVHRLEDADSLCAELQAAGIATSLRGANHRALYHFFAPFIPIGVLVPKAEGERAEVIALEHTRTNSAPPPLPATADEGLPAPG